MDNQRYGLETTQAKEIMLLRIYTVIHLIRCTLKSCNFTLNKFQDLVFTYFNQVQQCL